MCMYLLLMLLCVHSNNLPICVLSGSKAISKFHESIRIQNISHNIHHKKNKHKHKEPKPPKKWASANNNMEHGLFFFVKPPPWSIISIHFYHSIPSSSSMEPLHPNLRNESHIPPMEKGKSSLKATFKGDILVSWRVPLGEYPRFVESFVFTLPKTNSSHRRTWKLVLGRPAFPFGKFYFQGLS